MKRVQVIQVNELGPTLNAFYAGMHYSKRSKIKNDWVTMVAGACNAQKIKPVEEYPVVVACRLIFGPKGKRYDWDNAAATAKVFQDALVKKGILAGDSPKYISGGRIWCVKGKISATQFVI